VIAKVTRGDDMGGLVRYLLGPGRANEHTNMRVVAAGTGIDVAVGETLSDEERRHLVDQLDGPYLVAETAVSGGHVWHLSLTNAGDDRKLSEDEWAGAVRTAMAALDFDDGKPDGRPPTPWVAIHHGPSAGGNDHVHVAVSLVREDGTRASIWRDRVKLSTVCAQLEERYGLSVVDGRTAGAKAGVTRGEQEKAQRMGAPEPDRVRLERVVRAAAAASRDEAEFVRRLRSDGVLCRPRYAKDSQRLVVGYSVAVDGAAAGGSSKPVWFGGGRLARDLTLPSLRAGWRTVDDQGAAWRGEHQPAEPRERVVIGAEAWEEGARRARAVTDHLATIPIEDRAAWASAARDGAGVFAALSRRFEGDRPGALAAAADMLARSAQKADHREHRRSDMAGLATVAAQAALVRRGGSQGAAGWLLVAAELLRLAQAIERAHAARGELARAQELHRRAEAVVGHDWPRGREEQVAVAAPPKETPPPRRQGPDRGDFGR
jgi:hypothetical protein